MGYINGAVPDDVLVKIGESWIDGGRGLRVLPGVAVNFLGLQAGMAARGHIVACAYSAGAYRSYGTQVATHVTPSLFGLNASSVVALADVGLSTHGLGDRIDIVGPGNVYSRSNVKGSWWQDFLELLPLYGGVREFGDRDANHVRFSTTPTPAALAAAAGGDDEMSAEDSARLERIEQRLNDGTWGIAARQRQQMDWSDNPAYGERLRVRDIHGLFFSAVGVPRQGLAFGGVQVDAAEFAKELARYIPSAPAIASSLAELIDHDLDALASRLVADIPAATLATFIERLATTQPVQQALPAAEPKALPTTPSA